ncbi:hypothetical protein OG320_19190 [Microbispora sp. NBC_01189]|uniref:hypothetical protein n=1 Tax=Microbispora sp. NBC_01189 TaxID=2903583 RepID=UPI002E1566D6|nr:hypothetical protein OG320_19190 [Microbispora sp. NBC_01189]
MLEDCALVRDLVAAKGYDTRATTLACYGGAGFTEELRASAASDASLRLVGLDEIYGIG